MKSTHLFAVAIATVLGALASLENGAMAQVSPDQFKSTVGPLVVDWAKLRQQSDALDKLVAERDTDVKKPDGVELVKKLDPQIAELKKQISSGNQNLANSVQPIKVRSTTVQLNALKDWVTQIIKQQGFKVARNVLVSVGGGGGMTLPTTGAKIPDPPGTGVGYIIIRFP